VFWITYSEYFYFGGSVIIGGLAAWALFFGPLVGHCRWSALPGLLLFPVVVVALVWISRTVGWPASYGRHIALAVTSALFFSLVYLHALCDRRPLGEWRISRFITYDVVPTPAARWGVQMIQIIYLSVSIWFGTLAWAGETPVAALFGHSLIQGAAALALSAALMAGNFVICLGGSCRLSAKKIWVAVLVGYGVFAVAGVTSSVAWLPVRSMSLYGTLTFITGVAAFAALVSRRRFVAAALASLVAVLWIEGTLLGLSHNRCQDGERLRLAGRLPEAVATLQASLVPLGRYEALLHDVGLPQHWGLPCVIARSESEVSLARAYLDYGRYSDAYQWALEAEEVASNVGVKSLSRQALISVVEVQWRLGDTKGAASLLDALHSEASRAFNSPYWTSSCLLMDGRLAVADGAYRRALESFSRALQLARRSGSLDIAQRSLGGLGLAYEALGQLKEAESHYDLALVLAHRAGDDRAAAEALLGKGRACRGMSQPERSDSAIREAIRLAEGSHDQETKWRALYEQGASLETASRLDDAASRYREAVDVVEGLRRSLGDERERAHYFADKLHPYERLVLLESALGRASQAFDHAQRAKARAFLDLMGSKAVQYKVEDKTLGAQERVLRWKINALEEQVAEQSSGGGRRLAQLRQDLATAKAERQRVLARIGVDNPRLASLVTVATSSVSEVQDCLRTGEMLLDYFVTSDRTLLWVVTRSGFHSVEVPVGRSRLTELVSRVRTSIERRQGYDVQAAGELYRLLITPAQPWQRATQRLVVAPHDVLYMLPFEALVVEPSGPEYLGDRCAIVECESASMLRLSRGGATSAVRGNRRLLALGDPVFSTDDQRYGRSDVEAFGETGASRVLTRRVALDASAKEAGYVVWARLPSTGAEVRAIAARFRPTGAADILTGVHASESSVKRADHSAYTYETYATHGALAGDIPGLMEPALVLSLPNMDDEPSDDGYLTMTEVFGLRLNADLVTLSACNTRMGETVPGEGLIGMTRAFTYAGTPSVVASLWSVADESTSELMVAFYRHLQEGEPKAEALALAKRELRRMPHYSHPFFWAPFVLVGEG
jgi:CHAT domain-containing protein